MSVDFDNNCNFPFILKVILVGHEFPYKGFCRFIILFIVFLFSGWSFFLLNNVYPVIAEKNKKREEEERIEIHKKNEYRKRGFLIHKLHINYNRLKPKDASRFYDCQWKAPHVIPQPFYAYPYLRFFDSSETTDIFNGIKIINDWPSLLYVRNLDRYNHRKSRVLFQIRGSDYGNHKTNLIMAVLSLVNRNNDYQNDLIFSPDNYIFIDPDKTDITKDPVQAACHNRTYAGGRYVSNEWKFFENGAFWDVYDELFTNDVGQVNDNIIIFSYSNGSTPRNQLMRPKKIKTCRNDSFEEYMNCHKMKDIRSFRIKSILDLETLYDWNNLKPTAMFINLNIRNRPGRYYYAACVSNDCNLSNHMELIRLLKLKPIVRDNDWTRWQDEEERIVIDIVRPGGKYNLSHSSVIPFGVKNFEEISRGNR